MWERSDTFRAVYLFLTFIPATSAKSTYSSLVGTIVIETTDEANYKTLEEVVIRSTVVAGSTKKNEAGI